MDYDYGIDSEQIDIDAYAPTLKAHPFEDEDIRNLFSLFISGDERILLHDMFTKEYRKSDIDDFRITRMCTSQLDHNFKIQFLNGDQYWICLSDQHSFDRQIDIVDAAAGVGVEVPRNYFTSSVGIGIRGGKYHVLLREYIPGRTFKELANKGILHSGDKEIILREMGKRLSKIHEIKSVKDEQQEDVQTNFFQESLDLLNFEKQNIIDKGITSVEEFEEIFSHLDSMIDVAKIFSNSSLGLTHRNFYPHNVIVDTDKTIPQIKAIIGWSNATITNTYFDFAMWDYWYGEEFLIDSLLESYGLESFSSAESKVNVELTTVSALINTLCFFGHTQGDRASQLGIWQRLLREIHGIIT